GRHKDCLRANPALPPLARLAANADSIRRCQCGQVVPMRLLFRVDESRRSIDVDGIGVDGAEAASSAGRDALRDTVRALAQRSAESFEVGVTRWRDTQVV